jgi:hypothetical protein
MNKIVHQHVPASELPERLRNGIDASALVTVTVQEEVGRREPLTREQLRQLIEQAQKDATGVTIEEAVARIRALRDEWDD